MAHVLYRQQQHTKTKLMGEFVITNHMVQTPRGSIGVWNCCVNKLVHLLNVFSLNIGWTLQSSHLLFLCIQTTSIFVVGFYIIQDAQMELWASFVIHGKPLRDFFQSIVSVNNSNMNSSSYLFFFIYSFIYIFCVVYKVSTKICWLILWTQSFNHNCKIFTYSQFLKWKDFLPFFVIHKVKK